MDKSHLSEKNVSCLKFVGVYSEIGQSNITKVKKLCHQMFDLVYLEIGLTDKIELNHKLFFHEFGLTDKKIGQMSLNWKNVFCLTFVGVYFVPSAWWSYSDIELTQNS